MKKFFSTTCTHHSSDLTKVNLLTGNKNPNSHIHDAYNAVDTEVMRRFYESLVKFLSFKYTEIILLNLMKSKGWKKKHRKLENKLKK